MSSLLDAVADRVRGGRPYTDMGGEYDHAPPPPASAAVIAAAEARLGFALPPLLRGIYREVANGGFGPGYGLIGLDDGAPLYASGQKQSIVSVYEGFRLRPTRHKPWDEGLLPICTWGCTYFSYLDCAQPQAPVMGLDENSHGGGPLGCAFSRHAASFEEWMQRWLDGEDLWKSIGLSGEPKFGYEEYADDKSPFPLSRTYSALPEALFDAWLTPEIMRRWLFKRPGSDVESIEVDLRVGGRYAMLVGKGNEAIRYSGVYEAIERPRRLVFTLEAPQIFAGVSRVSVAIAPEPCGCRFALTHTGIPWRVVTGVWNYMLDALGRVLENG